MNGCAAAIGLRSEKGVASKNLGATKLYMLALAEFCVVVEVVLPTRLGYLKVQARHASRSASGSDTGRSAAIV